MQSLLGKTDCQALIEARPHEVTAMCTKGTVASVVVEVADPVKDGLNQVTQNVIGIQDVEPALYRVRPLNLS